MAAFFGLNDGVANDGLGDLIVLLDGTEGTPNAGHTSVTYSGDPFLPGISITLKGTGIMGTPSASWHITEIDATNSFAPTGFDWIITGITGVDGAPTGGPFDATSIFQAETFRNAPRLIFHGHDNTIVGGPGVEGLFGFGSEGNHETVSGGSGNQVISANGGIDTVFAGTGHYLFLFNSVDGDHPLANVSTIHHYNVKKDSIELNRFTFNPLSGTPELLPSEFHLGHAVGHKPQIVYNHANGDLFFDPHGTHSPHILIAVLDTKDALHHPFLTDSDLVVI
jgi:Ca2+-binding RTX toxin-like protein